MNQESPNQQLLYGTDFDFLGLGTATWVVFPCGVKGCWRCSACGSMKMTLETNKKSKHRFPSDNQQDHYIIFDIEFSKISLQLHFFGILGETYPTITRWHLTRCADWSKTFGALLRWCSHCGSRGEGFSMFLLEIVSERIQWRQMTSIRNLCFILQEVWRVMFFEFGCFRK